MKRGTQRSAVTARDHLVASEEKHPSLGLTPLMTQELGEGALQAQQLMQGSSQQESRQGFGQEKLAVAPATGSWGRRVGAGIVPSVVGGSVPSIGSRGRQKWLTRPGPQGPLLPSRLLTGRTDLPSGCTYDHPKPAGLPGVPRRHYTGTQEGHYYSEAWLFGILNS